MSQILHKKFDMLVYDINEIFEESSEETRLLDLKDKIMDLLYDFSDTLEETRGR